MPPVGNDIVDLADPENVGKSADGRFCRRLFNADELSMIAAGSSARPDSLLWAIWAAKEAAYKAISRGDPAVCSIPKKYPVIIETVAVPGNSACLLQGKVITPRGELPVHIFIQEDMLHALVSGTTEGLTRIISRVERVDANSADPSDLVRKILLDEIARRLGLRKEDLSVVKEQRGSGAPCVFYRGNKLPAEISLSHDGRFVAFAFDPATL